ncbi:MAG TPA: hypothetical protein VLH08_18665, partial [Acidobacteriota bacterium]|nr:hypothetical protein [Acidobacteriota bacterium]
EVNAASARWNILQGKTKEAQADLHQGLQNVREIISENAKAANSYALKGRLLLRQAQITTSQSEKQKHANSSQEMFQQAFRLYPGLARRYAKDTAELKKLL